MLEPPDNGTDSVGILCKRTMRKAEITFLLSGSRVPFQRM